MELKSAVNYAEALPLRNLLSHTGSSVAVILQFSINILEAKREIKSERRRAPNMADQNGGDIAEHPDGTEWE